MGLTRNVSGKSVPVYVWQSAATGALLSLFGPEELGGLGDLADKISKVTETDEAARMEAIASVSNLQNTTLNTTFILISLSLRSIVARMVNLLKSLVFLLCTIMNSSPRS